MRDPEAEWPVLGEDDLARWPARGWVTPEREGVEDEWARRYGKEAGGIALVDVARLLPEARWPSVVVELQGRNRAPWRFVGDDW
jgi:hypothetical protein